MDLGSTLRAARRQRDVSQRELADLAKVPVSTVARIESGEVTDPKFRTVERLLTAAGRRLLPVVADRRETTDAEGAETADADAQHSRQDEDGYHSGEKVGEDERAGPDDDPFVTLSVPHERLRDRGGRHYPAHLDVFDAFPWFDRSGEMLPAGTRVQTFHRNRGLRDYRREREAPGMPVEIEYHEAETGHAWAWLAVADGEVVGRLAAWIWPPATSPPEPPRLVVLCCLVMQPGWAGKSVERRLITRLRRMAAKEGNNWTVVTLAYQGPPWGYVRNRGFHPKVRGIQLLQLSR